MDGKLTEPMLQPKMTDRSRFRLPRYAMRIERGLILVDLSKVAPDPPPAGPVELGDIPRGSRRARGRQPDAAQGGAQLEAGAADAVVVAGAGLWRRVRQAVELGPLSLVALRDGDAALIRLIPKFPGQTEVEVVRLPRNGRAGDATDAIGEALDDGDAIDAKPLDRGFYDWYWPLVAPPDAA